MHTESDRDRLLDAAELLFYERGYQTVGMDALRAASQLSLKRIYALFDSKESIAVAMLNRRDERWHASLAAHVARTAQPVDRVLAVFDWLAGWLAADGHRGCAWVNAFGELGATSPAVAEAVRRHKARLHAFVAGLVTAADGSPDTAAGILLLIEGAIVTAGISGGTGSVESGKSAAGRLLIP